MENLEFDENGKAILDENEHKEPFEWWQEDQEECDDEPQKEEDGIRYWTREELEKLEFDEHGKAILNEKIEENTKKDLKWEEIERMNLEQQKGQKGAIEAEESNEMTSLTREEVKKMDLEGQPKANPSKHDFPQKDEDLIYLTWDYKEKMPEFDAEDTEQSNSLDSKEEQQRALKKLFIMMVNLKN